MKKRMVCFCLALALVLGLIPAAAFGASVVANGYCGNGSEKNITWTLYSDGLLALNGSGDMKNYNFHTVPWSNNCHDINRVIISSGITSIGNCAFSNCDLLTSVDIPNSVTSIGEFAFSYCYNLSSVDIPDGTITIGSHAFHWCKSMTTVTIPNSVTDICSGAFLSCQSLTYVTIPNSVTSISDQVFGGCIKLTDVTISSNATKIGAGAFYGTNISSIFIPSSVTSIGNCAFAHCTNLISVSIPSSVTNIEYEAFDCCHRLTSIIIPSGVPSIGSATFDYCHCLTNITIPVSVTNIGRWAFKGCNSLTDVYYEGSKAQWDVISIDLDNECLTGATIHYNFSGGIEENQSSFVASRPFLIGTGGDGKSMPKTAEVSGTIWNDEWFFEPSTTYNHELARTAITLSNADYVLDDKDKGINGEENMKGLLTQFGFDEDAISWNRIKPTAEDNDTVSFTLAAKKLNGGDGSQPTLILIDIKGTSSDEEWYSNFNIGETAQIHTGFGNASYYIVVNRLTQYLKEIERNGFLTDSSTRFLVTGHSRGAAVANLVAAHLNGRTNFDRTNIYGYTFATPAVASIAKKTGYENIFNILNQEDFVPYLPLEKWGFARFGIDLRLPSRSNYPTAFGIFNSVQSKMKTEYTTLCEKEFGAYPNGIQPVIDLVDDINNLAPTQLSFCRDNHWYYGDLFVPCTKYFESIAAFLSSTAGKGAILDLGLTSVGSFGPITRFFIGYHVIPDNIPLYEGSRIWSAHAPATYYSWMKTCTAEELFGDANWATKPTFKNLKVACPVDVFVYDENDDLVASVVNNEIVVNTLAVDVTDDVKTIHLPDGQEYRVEVVTNDSYEQDDTLTYSVTEYEGQETVSSVAYEDIPLEADSSFEGTVTTSEDEITPCTLSSSEETLEPDTVVLAERKSTMISDAAVELIDGAYQVTAKLSCPDASARVLCASYSPEGKMLDITSQAAAETISLRVKEDETAVTLKLFVVNSYGTPLDMCLPVKL